MCSQFVTMIASGSEEREWDWEGVQRAPQLIFSVVNFFTKKGRDPKHM